MTYRNIFLQLLSAYCTVLLFGCSDESPSGGTKNVGNIAISIDHIFADRDFELGNIYTTSIGEQIQGSTLRYFVSNIALIRADGSLYVVPQQHSYFLVDESIPSSKSLTLNDIPIGKYTGLRFMIGVDSLRSTMGLDQRTGVLDIGAAAQDMYWSWNSGYIHFKFEGSFTSPLASGDIRYHIGGFGGYSSPTINAIRSITLDLGNPTFEILNQTSKTIYLTADISKIFNGKTTFSVKDNPSVMFSPFSTTIADNYAVMFSVLQKD